MYLGMGGLNTSLAAAFRPSDLSTSTTNRTYWDNAFSFALGRMASTSTRYNYDNQQDPLALGTGSNRDYRYYETEAYLQDTWKVTPRLTMTYGIRYQYYSVPFETKGQEAVGNFAFNDYLSGRIDNGLAGVYGNGATPIIYYNLAGKANGQRGLYEPNLTNFAPRFSFAYTPNVLESIFGDKKTVIRGAAGIVYDHPVVNALNFIQDQNTYMFQSTAVTNYGASTSTAALLNDPRFTSIASAPAAATPPVVSTPFAPYYTASTGLATGIASGNINYGIDPGLKTPYSITFNLGFQRELPGHFVLESTYVGRLGRRLIAQADASQLVDFKDPVSGQMLSAAFANLTTQLRNGATYDGVGGPKVTPIPFFDNLVKDSSLCGSGTQFVVCQYGSLVQIGDITDTIQGLAKLYQRYPGVYGLPGNIGLSQQFAGNTMITNKASSNYHGLLTSIHKNMSNGLQFDMNYTFSHSIDNVSITSNTIASNSGVGYVCDATNLRICRGNSDFDITHIINGNFIYELPFGRGKLLGRSVNSTVDRFIGGWSISGVPTWRSGIAFTSLTGAYLMGYANNAPAIFNGDTSAIAVDVHRTDSGAIQLFKDPDKAVASYDTPIGFQIGSRNNLRGPGYVNLDLALAKKISVTERIGLNFRAEAYNVFNHPSFGLPGGGLNGAGADVTSGQFGEITNTSSSARVAQFSLRLEF
jgi:hypothetical protein